MQAASNLQSSDLPWHSSVVLYKDTKLQYRYIAVTKCAADH